MKLGTAVAVAKLIDYLENDPALDYKLTNPDHPLSKLVDDVRESFNRLEWEGTDES